MDSFTSEMEWDTLKIGPRSAINPKDKAQMRAEMEEEDD